MMKYIFLFFFMAFFGCQTQIQPSSLSQGKWGGEQCVMNVSSEKIDFTWGCGFGEITEKVVLSNGKFSISGTYKRGAGILPADSALWPKPQAAHYEGTLNGKTLQIKITLIDGNVDLGTYLLTLGQEEKISYCL
jgi:hypothetical protein